MRLLLLGAPLLVSCWSDCEVPLEKVPGRALIQYAAEANRSVALSESVAGHVTSGRNPLRIPADPSQLLESGHSTSTTAQIKSSVDSQAFLVGLCMNGSVCMSVLLVFSILRHYFPLVYSANAIKGCVPCKPSDGFFGWVASSFAYTADEAAATVGLDSALVVEFCSLGSTLLALIGLPLCLILGPLHALYGQGALKSFECLTLANVVPLHPWMYHVHSLAIIYVVVVTKMTVFQAQEGFLRRRFGWMKGMPALRASTILVEGIPKDYRSEEKLTEFFAETFGPSAVASIHIVKHTQKLASLVADRESAESSRREAELQFKKDDKRPTTRAGLMGETVDSIDHYSQERQTLDAAISAERSRIKDTAHVVGGVNSSSAFVTFKTRRDAAIATYVRYSAEENYWIMKHTPETSDIRWGDLQRDAQSSTMQSVAGYLCLVGVFLSFSPLCLAISMAAEEIDLGYFQPAWAALAPTIGLTLLLGFLPTILLLIFKTFFTLRSETLAQHELQVWYFWFLTIFVILLPVLGTNFRSFAQEVANNPGELLDLMADKIPSSTGFFNTFIALQWTTVCFEMTRNANLAKFILYSALYPKEEAKARAEPEDQDYNGIGGRSARCNLNLMVGIIFSTLSPLVSILALVCFLLQRLVFGYLTVFAETKKPDLGGHFWVESLRQILQVVLMYVVVMLGIVVRRSPNYTPPVLVLLGVVYAVISLIRFETQFRWEVLPFTEIVKGGAPDTEADKASPAETYDQPEMRE